MKDLEFNWDKITGALGKEGENIFETEVGKIENLCNGYDDKKDNSNIICIVGNRGCGKTSLINAVREKLKKNKNFFVTDIIDPSIFDDTLSISEFFISVLAEEVKNYKEEKESNNFGNNTEDKYIRFNKKLNDIMDVISHIKSNKERFYEDNCASDIVKTIQRRSNFAALLKELIEAFYGVLGKDQKTKMVVCIDDLDLVANQYVYQMTEDIQKWLNKNCIVILSFREIQLLNIIQDHFIQQNKNLMDKQIVSIAEIKDQTVQFYEKQMPVSRRIYLKGQKEFFTEKAWKILEPFAVKNENKYKLPEEKKNEYEKTNLHDLMENLVREKLALPLDPVDEKEKVHLIYPNGLREMLAFVRMLMEMDDIRDKENSKKDDNKNDMKKEKLQDNLKKYRDYILSRAKANLNMEYYSILEEWLKTSVRNKNYYICSKLDGILKEKVKDIGDYHSEGNTVSFVDDEDDNDESDDNSDDNSDSQQKDVAKSGEAQADAEKKGNSNIKNLNINTESEPLIATDRNVIYIERTETYNVIIGDVIQFIEKIKWALSSDEQTMCLCYLVKQLYSIELLRGFLEIKSKEVLDDMSDYFILTAGKFMPDDFLYTPQNENFINYIETKTVLNDGEIIKLLMSTGYSKTKRSSPIWQAARPKTKTEHSFYKHRPLFSPEFSLDRSKKTDLKANYKIDPFSAVLKRRYIEKINNDGYVFYSLFDVDAIMRMIFVSKKKEKIYYVYNKINRIFNGREEKTHHDGLLKQKISQLFKCAELKPIFDAELMGKLKEIDASLKKKDDTLSKFNDKKLFLQTLEKICEEVDLPSDEIEKIETIRKDMENKPRTRVGRRIQYLKELYDKYPEVEKILENMTEENEKS